LPDSLQSIGDAAFSGCDLLMLIVPRDSFAYKYAKENNITYTYTDSFERLKT
jgi:hypothetical protein